MRTIYERSPEWRSGRRRLVNAAAQARKQAQRATGDERKHHARVATVLESALHDDASIEDAARAIEAALALLWPNGPE